MKRGAGGNAAHIISMVVVKYSLVVVVAAVRIC